MRRRTAIGAARRSPRSSRPRSLAGSAATAAPTTTTPATPTTIASADDDHHAVRHRRRPRPDDHHDHDAPPRPRRRRRITPPRPQRPRRPPPPRRPASAWSRSRRGSRPRASRCSQLHLDEPALAADAGRGGRAHGPPLGDVAHRLRPRGDRRGARGTTHAGSRSRSRRSRSNQRTATSSSASG